MAHATLMALQTAAGEQERFVAYLFESDVQLPDGGWPEWSAQKELPNIVASIYMMHFLYQFQATVPKHPYISAVHEAIERTLRYLAACHRNGLWHQSDREATKRFYPTLYLLAFPVMLRYGGRCHPIIEAYPILLERLSKNGRVQLKDESKSFRTTLRYVANFYFHSYFSLSMQQRYSDISDSILKELPLHHEKLNAHEILGAYLLAHSRFNPSRPPNCGFEVFFEDTRRQGWSLIDRLQAIPPGNKEASRYQETAREILEFVFLGALERSKIEQPIDEGRKRADISFYNCATTGFLYDLSTRFGVHCPYVIVECKNFAGELSSREYDQLSGRFSARRGRFGILACRRVVDRNKVIAHCRDIARDDRGLVLVLTDEDLVAMIDARCRELKDLDGFLEGKIRELMF